MNAEALCVVKLIMGLISTENQGNQMVPEVVEKMVHRRGGARPGSGRKPKDLNKWLGNHYLKPATAAEVLERANERRLWYRILTSEDDAIVLRGLIFLTEMRDGKASQRIDITSKSLNVTVDDIAKYRALIQEIRGESNPALGLESSSPSTG